MPEAAATLDRPYRFAVGARERFVGDYADVSQAFGTTLPTIDIPAGDFTEGVYIRVDASVPSNNSANVTFNGDGPFSVLAEVQLQDPQGVPFQILSGWELYAWNLLGGFTGQGDSTLSPYYTAVTGSGTTGGNFSFVLRIPCELFPRDGVGALYNGSTASQFKVRVTLNTSANTYGTAPTALPTTVRVRFTSHGYQLAQALPSGHPFDQEPPGGAIYNTLTRQVFQFSGAGTLTVPIIRKGFLYRQMLFVVRDNSGVRSNTVLTDAVLRIDNVDHWNGSYNMWRHVTWERNRSTGAQLPAGLVQQSFCHDWDGLVGGETRDQYVPTSPGSIVEMRLTAAAAGSLTILVNDVTPTKKAIEAGIVKV